MRRSEDNVLHNNRLLLLTAVCSLSCLNAHAATYYVTQSGAGSGNGTSLANAWSVAAFNASGVPTGGDTVNFSGTLTSSVIPGTNGTAAARLTLDFTGATLSGSNPRIQINGNSYINLLGGTFGTASSGSLIRANGQIYHDVKISGWTFIGPAGAVVSLLDGKYPQFVELSNNYLDNCTLGYSDTTNTHDLLIKNNFIRGSNNTTDQTDIISFGDAYNVTIEGNKLIQQAPGATSGRHNDTIQTFESGATPHAPPYGWVIRYNWIEVNVPSGSGDTSMLMMELMGDHLGVPALKIYGNVFVGDPTDSASNNGICNDQNSSPYTVYFYNNTVIRKSGPDNTIRFLSPGTLYARNNIGYATNTGAGTYLAWTMTAGAQWNRNFFFHFDQCSAATSGPNGSCSTDPRFVDYTNNNFSLQSGSTLVGAGDSSIGTEFNQGIAPGATWPNPTLVARPSGAWDIGAYQSGGVVAPPPPPPSGSACDVNQDSVTNVADVQQCVNQSLGVATCTADINKDGICNVVDVQRVVNAALGGQCVTQ